MRARIFLPHLCLSSWHDLQWRNYWWYGLWLPGYDSGKISYWAKNPIKEVSYLVSYLVWPRRRANHLRGRGLSGLVHEKDHPVCPPSHEYFLVFPIDTIFPVWKCGPRSLVFGYGTSVTLTEVFLSEVSRTRAVKISRTRTAWSLGNFSASVHFRVVIILPSLNFRASAVPGIL